MKQLLFFTCCILFSHFTSAQKISYGLVLGGSLYSNASSGSPTFRTAGSVFTPNLGGYGEYSLNERFGVKTELTFNKRNLKLPDDTNVFTFGIVELTPSFKWDFGNEYRKGGYLLIGPKFSMITNVKYNEENLSDAFENTFISGQAAIGSRILSYFDLQFRVEYGITPFFKNETTDNDDFFIASNISLNLDLEKILNKN